MTNKFFKFLIILIFALPANLKASDQPFKKGKNNSSKKVTITTIKSKIINVKRKSGIIEFENDVIVEQGDISFTADKMVVYYQEKVEMQKMGPFSAKDKSGSLKQIEAQNNVKIYNEEFIATGKTGIYDPDKGTFTILENVVVNKGTSLAKGDKFVYNINTKKGDLIGKKIVKVGPEKNLNHESLEDGRVMVIIGEEAIEKNQDKKKTKNNQKNSPNNNE